MKMPRLRSEAGGAWIHEERRWSLLPELPCFDRDNTDGKLVVHQSTKAGEEARHIRGAASGTVLSA